MELRYLSLGYRSISDVTAIWRLQTEFSIWQIKLVARKDTSYIVCSRLQSPKIALWNFNKWHGISYMPSRTDTAGHTEAVNGNGWLMDDWGYDTTAVILLMLAISIRIFYFTYGKDNLWSQPQVIKFGGGGGGGCSSWGIILLRVEVRDTWVCF